MEMNRYLIAALYVMAGCAVTIPLKAQTDGASLRAERCRLMVTNTVRVITVCVEENETEQDFYTLPLSCYSFSLVGKVQADHIFAETVRIYNGSLCRTSHKIRAPESFV